ncbi:MAG: fused MFS/spermidine synthase [Verrucomicrobiota bacterium]
MKNLNHLLTSDSAKMFWVSFFILFLEMFFIRWLATEVRIFAYLQNIVLIACFLGISIGCLSSDKEISIIRFILPILILCGAICLPYIENAFINLSLILSLLDDFVIWYLHVEEDQIVFYLKILIGLVLSFFILLMLVDNFIIPGRLLGRFFRESNNTIKSYSWNIAGSLAGILFFAILGYASINAWLWSLVIFAFSWLVFQSIEDYRCLWLLILIPIFILTKEMRSGVLETYWSPYQKLELKETSESPNAKEIIVNNVGYQMILDFTRQNLSNNTDLFSTKYRNLSQYDLPARFHGEPHNVLIMGAGSGNDAAGALRNGANNVVAVDIDPVIVELGKRYHPERPYDSEKVEIIVNDARSYLTTTEEKFDLVILGLLDAHTSASITNVRLDHYLYTVESFMQIKKVLKEDGLLVLSFAMANDFIVERMIKALHKVFGESPYVFGLHAPREYGWGGVMYIAGNKQRIKIALEQNEDLARYIKEASVPDIKNIVSDANRDLATDDWPYIYLRKKHIPTLFYIFAAIICVIYFLRMPWDGIKSMWRGGKDLLHFSSLGAGFLLLEVTSISKSSLVLGNTWITSAVIISGVMIMILVANLIVAKFPKINIYWCFGGLLLYVLGLYLFDYSILLQFDLWKRAVAIGVVLTLPLLFSGIIFIHSFARSKNKDVALGINLLGAIVGALLQSISFVTGIQFIMLLVLGFYLTALVFKPTQLQET